MLKMIDHNYFHESFIIIPKRGYRIKYILRLCSNEKKTCEKLEVMLREK